jgi:Family of unknown function (DUF5522)
LKETNLISLVEGEDFYREGAALVFTALYHLRRGYCCESGCRHCPFDEAARANVLEGNEQPTRHEAQGEC